MPPGKSNIVPPTMLIHEVKLLHHIDVGIECLCSQLARYAHMVVLQDGQTLIKRLSSFLAQANGRPHPSETLEDTRDAFEVL